MEPTMATELTTAQPALTQTWNLEERMRAGVRKSTGDSLPTNAEHDRSGRSRIGKYEILAVLGRGGQATAYLAIDPDLQRQVVIKYYHSATSEQERSAVLNEGRALAQVRSPYVAQCYGADRHGDIPYLVVEYLPGMPLSEFSRNRSVTVGRALELATQIAEGLNAIHECGLLHRDLKPSNVIIGDDGKPRIVDFGLAIPIDCDLHLSISGTPAYMAPEQARGEVARIGRHTDLFGLGALLLELLTGRPPYQAATLEATFELACAGQLVIDRARVPGVTSSVVELLRRLLASDPLQRFPSCAELMLELRRLPELREPGIQFQMRIFGWKIRLALIASLLLICGLASGLPWFESNAPETALVGDSQLAMMMADEKMPDHLARKVTPSLPTLQYAETNVFADDLLREFDFQVLPVSEDQCEIRTEVPCRFYAWWITAEVEQGPIAVQPIATDKAIPLGVSRFVLESPARNRGDRRVAQRAMAYFLAITDENPTTDRTDRSNRPTWNEPAHESLALAASATETFVNARLHQRMSVLHLFSEQRHEIRIAEVLFEPFPDENREENQGSEQGTGAGAGPTVD